jgi:hypothetical protein
MPAKASKTSRSGKTRTPGEIFDEVRPIEAAIRRAVARAVAKPAALGAASASRARRKAAGATRKR